MKISKEKAKEVFLLHANTKDMNEKIKSANNIIKKAKKKFKQPYISFSGGKDSHVVIDLVTKEIDNIMIYHRSQEKFMPKKFQKEIDNIMISASKNLIYKKRSNDIWKEIIPEFYEAGYDCCFLGCRIEESCFRKFRHKNKISLGKIQEIWPIYDWSWLDVWTYIFKNKLNYLSTYDIYCPIIGWDKARFHDFFGEGHNVCDKFGLMNLDKMLLWRYQYDK